MIPHTTPPFTLLHRTAEHRQTDDTVVAYVGDGFNDTTFKAKVVSTTREPSEIGKLFDTFARDLFEPAGGTCEPFEVDPMDDPML